MPQLFCNPFKKQSNTEFAFQLKGIQQKLKGILEKTILL